MADEILLFFAMVGVIALVGFAVYTLMCVMFAIGDIIWMHRLEKKLKKTDGHQEVHDDSMD